MEIRIGEMTFDYELLFERIRHSSEIVKTLKDKFNEELKNYLDLEK